MATPAFSWITPARTIGDVIARLSDIDRRLPQADGVACFNRVYLRMTEAILDWLDGHRFEDSAYMERLDIRFAQRYFDAVHDLVARPEAVPRAWRALFDARASNGVTALRFAIAGMNAHINYDLGLALVATCEERGVAPETGSAQHRDYLMINAVLEDTARRVKGWLLTDPIARLDAALGECDDDVAHWSIRRARDAAWTQAETLWELRRLPRLQAQFVQSLDRFVAFAGQGLLAPQLVCPPQSGRRID